MKRIKKVLSVAPTRAEMEALVSDVRLLKIQIMSMQADREAKIKKIDDQFAKILDPKNADLEEKTARIQAWAEANPQEFGNRKSIELTHGTIGFRTGTPKLVLLSRAWTWAKSLVQVQNLLPAFIRNTPEIDKEAILAQRDEQSLKWALPVCGLKVTQDESFYIDPKIEEPQLRETREAA